VTTFDPRTVHSTQATQFSAPQIGTQQFPGQQFPGLVPPPSLSKPPRNRRPMAAKIVAGAVAAGLVLGGAGAWMAFSGSSAEAAVQSTSFAGAHPTTSPFGTDAPQVAAVAATGPQTGDTAGLYAATTPPSCTTADFLTQLKADPNKLAGFGGVFGLGATDVPAFVNSLSPVVLRANTSVTDHPFTDGAFVEQPAILAAGTAVLVNSYGEPTVKCFNGNPLTGGAPVADAISVIPTDQVVASFQFTSIDNSSVVVVPGKPDPKPNKGHNPDPFLAAKAEAAQQLADNARTEATTARAAATAAAQAQTTAQTNLDAANIALQQAALKLNSINPVLDPVGFQQAQQAAIQASINRNNAANALQTAKGQAAAADQKAKGLEDTATADEQAAAKAKQDAEDSKHPHNNHDKDQHKDQDKEVDAKKVDDPTATTGTNGKIKPGLVQTPGTATTVCQNVVTDAATAPICPLTGSADTATGTTPATGAGSTSTGTTSGSTSTGSTSKGTSSGSGSSSSSSSSSTGSQGTEKGASGK
jgi:hypothetical protein